VAVVWTVAVGGRGLGVGEAVADGGMLASGEGLAAGRVASPVRLAFGEGVLPPRQALASRPKTSKPVASFLVR